MPSLKSPGDMHSPGSRGPLRRRLRSGCCGARRPAPWAVTAASAPSPCLPSSADLTADQKRSWRLQADGEGCEQHFQNHEGNGRDKKADWRGHGDGCVWHFGREGDLEVSARRAMGWQNAAPSTAPGPPDAHI